MCYVIIILLIIHNILVFRRAVYWHRQWKDLADAIRGYHKED